MGQEAMDDNAAPMATGAKLLARIRIVLVETSHPGNIGAVARAMKTMGLNRLVLVNPREFPSAVATARASGADDILMRAQQCESLQVAIADCEIVIGTTARSRHLEWPVGHPREISLTLPGLPPATQIALVFGREQSGLSNQEMALCQRVIRIPTDEQFSSLNIAQAVQICAYELRMAAVNETLSVDDDEPLATQREMMEAIAHLMRVMEAVEFYNPQRPKLLPIRVQRLLNRSELRRSEVRILRGFLTAIEETRTAASGTDLT
jgi:tRNA (cytidine32/uridine32-2'-O)-methyltransferase